MALKLDWLGPFVEEEVRSVIKWSRQLHASPRVKPETDVRFSDDGSNFRSKFDASAASHDLKVRIVSVISTDDPVTVEITDGFTRLRARLSEAAVAALQDETDTKIDFTTTDDVIAIKRATVISTPIGFANEHVQLTIDDVDYMYHLRKPIGRTIAIEERPTMSLLIQDINCFRIEQYTRPDQTSSPLETRIRGSQANSNIGGTPKSQQSMQRQILSSPATNAASPMTQAAMATQVPVRRKQHAPSLSNDGLEIQDGVNLAGPVQLRKHNAGVQSNSVSHMSSGSNGISGAKLLGLLGKRKAEAPPEVIDPPNSPPAISTESATNRLHSHLVMQHSNHSAQAATAQFAHQTSPQRSWRNVYKDYSRRKIPKDQQKLLDHPSSWFPSLPGQQFPRPNVPVQLLKRWNDQVPKPPRARVEADSANELDELRSVVSVAMTEDAPMDTSEDISEEGESSDGEVSESEWPPSQVRPGLPPDSTMASNPGNAASPDKKIPQNSSAARMQPSSPVQHSIPPRFRMQDRQNPRILHPLPKKPDWISASNDTPRVSQNPLRRPDDSLSESRKRQSRDSSAQVEEAETTFESSSEDDSDDRSLRNERRALPSNSMSPSFMRPSPKHIKRQHYAPSGTTSHIVKGTQLIGADGDELEMSVPRSLGEDPSVAHHRRRREYFKAARRKNW